MFCPKCGNQLVDNAKFCIHCGKPIKAPAQKTGNIPPAGNVGAQPPVRNTGVIPPAGNVGAQPRAKNMGGRPRPGNTGAQPPVRNTGAQPPAGGAGARNVRRYDPYEQEGSGKINRALIIGIIVAACLLVGIIAAIIVIKTGVFNRPYQVESTAANATSSEEHDHEEAATENNESPAAEPEAAQPEQQPSGDQPEEYDTNISRDTSLEEDQPEEREEEEEPEEDERSEYILPDSDHKYLKEKDIEGLNAWETRIARNELYARHGRKFDDEELQEYFNKKDWYEGRIDPSDFKESMLNDYEVYNRDLIVEYEKEQGYR